MFNPVFNILRIQTNIKIMDRKLFLKKIATSFFLGIPLISMWSCSDSDIIPIPGPGPNANCLANGTNSSIGSNHGHTLSVSAADVTSGIEKIYDIQGSSVHSHQVTVTAAHFVTLASNQSVVITSTSAGHTHSVTISCA